MFGGFFGGDDDEGGENEMDRERKEDLDRILSRYDQRFDQEIGGGDGGRIASREYQEYQEAEEAHSKRTWYERLVGRLAFFNLTFSDTEKDQRNALRLLHYDVPVEQVAPAAVVVALVSALLAIPPMFLLNMPAVFMFASFLVPLAAFYYVFKYPELKSKKKVVRSSEDLILAVLYMVIYMRSSPALEGAVSFAARHLHGPVSSDLKQLLWRVDMGEYTTLKEALRDYVLVWRPYNRGFVDAVDLVVSATSEGSQEKRNEILTEAMNTLLDATREQMRGFAQDLKMPVMVLHGIGILLPVLGIILFPMVAAFMGGGGMIFYLIFLYNVLIPGITYALMQNLLVSRPLSRTGMEHFWDASPGNVRFAVAGRKMDVPAWIFGVLVFLILAPWPLLHFYQVLVQGGSFPLAPSMVMLIQEMSMVLAIGLPFAVYLLLGYRDAVEEQRSVRDVEEGFPQALFELANQLDRGNPIEIAVDNVRRDSGDLSVSDLFSAISRNIRDRGSTFEEAVFDPEYGAVNMYNSRIVRTVMEVVNDASRKGTQVAARALEAISKYLKNIRETEERMEELLEETVSSVKFLGYVLAPVIAGVAVGMGSVISLAFDRIGAINEGINQTAGGGAGIGGSGATSITSVFNFDAAIPPGLLQLVVGIYLVELAFILGTLIVRIEDGPDPYKRNVTIAKLLISSLLFYMVVVLIIVTVFGGIIQGAL